MDQCELARVLGLEEAFLERLEELLRHSVAAVARGGQHVAVAQHGDGILDRDDLLEDLSRAHRLPPWRDRPSLPEFGFA
jgi:hypothetical protein